MKRRIVKQGMMSIQFPIGTESPAWLLHQQGEDFITDHIHGQGSWEPELVEHALRLLPERGRLLDVGASLGTWTIPIARARPLGEVIAFEPRRESFYQLCGNIFLNNLENVVAHEVALGGRDPDRTSAWPRAWLYQPDAKSVGGTTLVPRRLAPESDLMPQSSCEVRTLDGYGRKHVEIIKIDVEGYELEVLRGATETLARWHPIIFFESWDPEWRGKQVVEHRRELFDFLTQHGYRIDQLTREDFLASHPQANSELPAFRKV